MTQAALAKRVGVHRIYVARIEGGAEMPSAGLVERIAKALDANLSPLLATYRARYDERRESRRQSRRLLTVALSEADTTPKRALLERKLVELVGLLRRMRVRGGK